LRFLAGQEKHEQFTVACRTDHNYLYEDFATDIVNYDPESEQTNMWMCEDWVFNYPKGYDLIIKPQDCREFKQEFIKYGKKGKASYDILIHARSTDKYKTGYRNWSEKSWDEFVESYPDVSIASIGTRKGALHIDNTDDMRGLPLDKLCDLMVSSDVLVGPSSGPMHLGSLCGTPHVTWSPVDRDGVMSNKERYEEVWNPHDTPVTFLDIGWDPGVGAVISAVRKMRAT
jgi:hypothetical protein